MRILLIEDNPRFVDLLRHSLKGVDLVVAETMSQALEQLNHQRFILALVDLGLPDSLAGDTLLALKCFKLPKIVITAGSSVTPLMAAEQGASDYIEKTTPLDQLVGRIQFNIEKHRPKKRCFEPAVFEQIKGCLAVQKVALLS